MTIIKKLNLFFFFFFLYKDFKIPHMGNPYNGIEKKLEVICYLFNFYFYFIML